jgi:hypothetical protein
MMAFTAPKLKKILYHDYDAVQIGMYYQLVERAPSAFWAGQEENEGSMRIITGGQNRPEIVTFIRRP